MLFQDISLIDENFDYREHMWLGTIDDRIAYLDTQAPEDPSAYGEVYAGEGRLLMPAFYNVHAHAPMTLLRGYAENLSLQSWLNDMVWPFEAKMTGEDNYWATLLACAEMARYGCVSFSDMYYHTPERAQAVAESGLKANLCTSPIAFEPKDITESPCYEEMEDGIARFNGAENGRIKFDACIHAEYTNNDVTTKSVIEWGKKYGVGMQLHLSETQSEVNDCRARHDGKSPAQWLDSLGAFELPVTAAHCVWVDDADIALMAEKGVSAAYNPASNMKLASGFAPIAKMLEAGVNVCIGTDGMASNNNHDMFQDMYLMGLLSKGYELNPAIVLPKEIIAAATVNGAKAQGRSDCGLVKQGFKADLTVLDITGASWCPMTNPLVNIIYAGHGSDVVLTMCDGAVVYRDGEWPNININEVKQQVDARTKRIIAELS